MVGIFCNSLARTGVPMQAEMISRNLDSQHMKFAFFQSNHCEDLNTTSDRVISLCSNSDLLNQILNQNHNQNSNYILYVF